MGIGVIGDLDAGPNPVKGKAVPDKGVSLEEEVDILNERIKDPYSGTFQSNRRKQKAYKAANKHYSLVVGEDIPLDRVQYFTDCALVGRLENTKASFATMKDWTISYWRPLLQYNPLFSTLVNGWYMFHFRNTEDREKIERRTWLIGRGSLVLQRWSVGFNPAYEQHQVRHLWVSLWGLPVQFWYRNLLVRLANTIGKFLFMDDSMIRSHEKRRALILVEFQMGDGLPEEIDIIWEGKVFCQKIDYLFIPFRCFRCQQTGHLRSQCKERTPAVSSRTSYHSMGESKRFRVRAGGVPGSGPSDQDSQSGKDSTLHKFKYEDLSVDELAFIDNLEKKALEIEKDPPLVHHIESDKSGNTVLNDSEHETSPDSGGIGKEHSVGIGCDSIVVSSIDPKGVENSDPTLKNDIPVQVVREFQKQNFSGPETQFIDDYPPGFSEFGGRGIEDIVHSKSSDENLGLGLDKSTKSVSRQSRGPSLGTPMPKSFKEIALAHLPVYKDSSIKSPSVSPFKQKYPLVTIRKRRKGRRYKGSDEYDSSIPLSSRLSTGSAEMVGRKSEEGVPAKDKSVVSGALRGLPSKGGAK